MKKCYRLNEVRLVMRAVLLVHVYEWVCIRERERERERGGRKGETDEDINTQRRKEKGAKRTNSAGNPD